MADNTHIEWTSATWNVITGCEVLSPGCADCYAMKLAGTRLRNHPSRAGLTRPTKAGPVWTGEVRFNEEWLDQPLRWSKPRDIFVVAHGDLFHKHVRSEWIDRLFAVMALAPQHRFQVLTKRLDRMLEYITDWPQGMARFHHVAYEAKRINPLLPSGGPGAWVWDLQKRWPLPNVWLGTSVENQTWADKRREPLAELAKQGWNTWVSYEPALGMVDWSGWEFLRWMVSGGESGDRPTHPAWHRAARDFCTANRIPYFFKQWGSWWAAESNNGVHRPPAAALTWPEGPGDRFKFFDDCAFYKVGKRETGSVLDGREWKEMPA